MEVEPLLRGASLGSGFFIGVQMQIKFLKWDKYNKRQKDIKRPFWFAMSNRFFRDPDLIDFTEKERLTFIYLLCEASDQNNYGQAKISVAMFSRDTGYSEAILYKTLDKLLKLKVAAEWRQDGGGNATATEQDSKQDSKQDKTVLADLDFEFLYKKYPLKKGKQEGMARIKKVITSQEELDLFSMAIDRYVSDIKFRGTEAKYIKHFSTFVGYGDKQPWRDWLDSDAGFAITVRSNKYTPPSTERKENLDEEFFGSKK